MPSPIKWHGGKTNLAERFIAMMPPHVHYVEPYFGGGSILFAKDCDNISEVVNDLDGDLTTFWKVLANSEWFSLFQRRVEATPFSEPIFNQVVTYQKEHGNLGNDPVEIAYHFFILCRQSLAGRMKNFATLTKNRIRRRMNEQASAWWSAIDGLDEVHERFSRVVVVGPDPGVKVIKREDSPNTFFYCDPPYLQNTRTAKFVYKYEMTKDDHQQLLEILSGIEGKFMLSGYPSKLYDSYCKKHGWRLHTFEVPNSAAGGKAKRTMVECVWMNY